MNLHRVIILGFVAVAAGAALPAQAGDWLTLPSTFTHDPLTGCRVNQFAAVDAPPLNDQSALLSSGYTNFRSTIQVGQSADNYYRVDQWGPPVRPYGEWLFPYRPYSAPYEAWGAPFAGLNLGFGVPAYPQGAAPHWGRQPGPPRRGGGGGTYPGGVYPGTGMHPGAGVPGHIPGQPINPYPVLPGGAHPEPPWYDGFHRDYQERPWLRDKDFYNRPPYP
jgi:hypothetical protein